MLRRPMALFVMAVMLLAGAAVSSGENAAPAGPIAFFDSFEKPATYWVHGDYATDLATQPGGTSRRLAKFNKRTVTTEFRANMAGVDLVGRFPTKDVHLGLKVNGKDLKVLQITLNGEFVFASGDVKDGAWSTITCNVAQFQNKDGKRPPADIKIVEIDIAVGSKSGNLPLACIDDFILTVAATPAQVWPTAVAADAEKIARLATPNRHGFFYSDEHEQLLKAGIKGAPAPLKARSVLVAAYGKNAAEFKTALGAAAAGFTVASVTPPPEMKIVTPLDLRMFLPYAIGQTGAEMVVIAPTPLEISTGSMNEALALSHRCLQLGTVPLWVLPVIPPKYNERSKTRLTELLAKWQSELESIGAPTISAAFAVKDPAAQHEGDELNAAGYQALSNLTAAALTHVDRYLRGRKKPDGKD